jgi:hypothetical protein
MQIVLDGFIRECQSLLPSRTTTIARRCELPYAYYRYFYHCTFIAFAAVIMPSTTTATGWSGCGYWITLLLALSFSYLLFSWMPLLLLTVATAAAAANVATLAAGQNTKQVLHPWGGVDSEFRLSAWATKQGGT